jgi:excisionase family DNA binding protein
MSAPASSSTQGSRTLQTPDRILERLCGRVEAIETILGGLSKQFPSLGEKLDGLHELVAGHRKNRLTTEEVAALTGRSEYTVRRWITEGKLRAVRITEGGPRGRLLIQREELERLVTSGVGASIPAVALGRQVGGEVA